MTTGNQIKIWQKEYKNKGIPSSFRSGPSASVEYFLTFSENQGIKKGHALDSGAGRGRNSFHLARKGFEVTAIDFVPENIAYINEVAKSEQLKVTAHCQSMADNFPLPDNSISLAIDNFSYFHLTDKKLQLDYRQELFRVLSSEGLYLLALAGDDDEFYGPFLKNSPMPQEKLVIDPYMHAEAYLYSKTDIENEFCDFEILDFVHEKKLGPMHGKEYLRSALIFIMKKKFSKN